MRTNNSNSDFEGYFKASMQDLQEKVKITGSDTGGRCLPVLTQDSYAPLFEEYHLKSQDLIDQVGKKYLPRTTILEANHATENASKEHQSLQNALVPLKHRRQEIEAKLKNEPSSTSLKYIIAQIAIGIICLAEGIFNIPIFESWGLNLVESVFAGLLFAGILCVYAHVIPWIISLGKTVWQRRLIIFCILVLTCALFWYLGDMRSQYFSAIASSEGAKVTFNSLPFTLASLLMMILAISLPIMYYPSDEELEQKRKRRALIKERRSLAKKISGIEEKIKKVEGQKQEAHTSGATDYETGSLYEQQAISNAFQLWSIFKNTSLLHRADRLKPDCQNEQYPFTFRTHFQINNQQIQHS